jgi:hypothetical protein
MKKFPPVPIPTVAQRALELRAIGLPGARASYRGQELNFHAGIAPGNFGRLYRCLLRVLPDGARPDMIVVEPDLALLAGRRKIPHTYAYKGKGTCLCLWWPKKRDWVPQMKFADTLIPWTAEWLYYFEIWLKTGEWAGGGVHPDRTHSWACPTISVPAGS